MKIKYILLVALAALAFSLASLGGVVPAIAGGNGGISGGDVHSIAAGNGGVSGGDVHARVLVPSELTLAGRKPGASSGIGV